jgi:hypothetical protein
MGVQTGRIPHKQERQAFRFEHGYWVVDNSQSVHPEARHDQRGLLSRLYKAPHRGNTGRRRGKLPHGNSLTTPCLRPNWERCGLPPSPKALSTTVPLTLQVPKSILIEYQTNGPVS